MSDNGTPPLSSSTRVVVTVADVNDHAPVFEQMYLKVSIPESTSLDTPLFQVRKMHSTAYILGLTFDMRRKKNYIS
mgnify:CR=1 FL=1